MPTEPDSEAATAARRRRTLRAFPGSWRARHGADLSRLLDDIEDFEGRLSLHDRVDLIRAGVSLRMRRDDAVHRRSPRWHSRGFGFLGGASLLAAALILVLGAVPSVLGHMSNHAAAHARHRSAAEQPHSSVIAATHIVSHLLPQVDQPPTSLAIAPGGTAWFWTDSATAVTLCSWNPQTGSFSSRVLGAPRALGLISGIQGATAVASTGTVWIGANENLASFDPATGAVQVLHLPARAADPTGQSGRPSQLVDLETISVMTSNDTGTVAIVSTGTTTVEVLHSSSHTFTSISVGTGFEAVGAAYLKGGILAISESSDTGGDAGRLVLQSPQGVTTLVDNIIPGPISARATTVLSNGTGSEISAAAVVSTSVDRPSLAQTQTTALPVEATGETVPVGNTRDSEAWNTPGGIAVASASGVQELLKLPTYSCHPGATSRMPAATAPSDTDKASSDGAAVCGEEANILASTPAANGIFFIPNSPAPAVDYVPEVALRLAG